ncbi:hypothetical protein WDW89_06605 [Deltaproteobacteria bacterium TL4]
MKIKILAVGLILLLIPSFCFALEIGKTPSKIVLKGDLGGKVDGTPWDSSDIKEKVFSLFYWTLNI